MVEKIKACLLAGALGDSYGGRFENMDVPSKDEVWRFSDETQLTVATCEAILEHRKVDPGQIANQFVKWYRAGRLTGLGASTLKALVELSAGADWMVTGAKGDKSAGNGAAMRIAPLAFLLDPVREADRDLIRQICRITHHNEEAYLGALAITFSIRFILNDRQNFITQVIRQLPDSAVRDRLNELSREPGLSVKEMARKFGNSGYVVDAVPLAMFSAQQATQRGIAPVFREIAAAGGDTDTICSMTGQIAGTFLGMDGLPEDWMEKVRTAGFYEDYVGVFREFANFVTDQKGVITLF